MERASASHRANLSDMTALTITIDGVACQLDLERSGALFSDGKAAVEVLEAGNGEITIRAEGRIAVVPYIMSGSEIAFSFEGETYTAEIAGKGGRTRTRHREQSMAAPMPGLVLRILVEAGAVVEKGAPLIILEAMKMEHTIAAPRAGRIVAVRCTEGELVQPGPELVEIEA
jgi:biotin carboxyl carrier protein